MMDIMDSFNSNDSWGGFHYSHLGRITPGDRDEYDSTTFRDAVAMLHQEIDRVGQRRRFYMPTTQRLVVRHNLQAKQRASRLALELSYCPTFYEIQERLVAEDHIAHPPSPPPPPPPVQPPHAQAPAPASVQFVDSSSSPSTASITSSNMARRVRRRLE